MTGNSTRVRCLKKVHSYHFEHTRDKVPKKFKVVAVDKISSSTDFRAALTNTSLAPRLTKILFMATISKKSLLTYLN